jgi:hypothetical protein
MVHIFGQKLYPQVKYAFPSPADFPIPNELQHNPNMGVQVMARNRSRNKMPDEILPTSQDENIESKNLKNTPISSIPSPSQG